MRAVLLPPDQGQMPRPRLTIKQVLAWADAHFERTGKWPKTHSGRIWETADETWSGVNAALRDGYRSLPKGRTLARLLEKHRGVRNHRNLPPLTVEKILGWMDAFRARTGKWPTKESGDIPEEPGETWHAVQSALAQGVRGLPGGSSLPRLLAEHHQVRNPKRLSKLTVHQILAWADEHHRRTGMWPTHQSGVIEGTVHETWFAVDQALRVGRRGLRSDSSLSRVLSRYRGVRNVQALPDLTLDKVLKWCDAHRRRTGKWPQAVAEEIPRSGGETWAGVNHALRHGRRRLPQTTLANLLAEHRGVRNYNRPPRLTKKLIRQWARSHKAQTGVWPHDKSGRVLDDPQESWAAIDMALRSGGRGLPGGSSLSRLLRRRQPK